MKIQRGYIIAFLLLLFSYIMIFYVIIQLDKKAKMVTHSDSVINTLNSIKGEITDAETGVRGYVITKDSSFLTPYRSGSRNVVPLIVQLKHLTADNGSFQPSIDSLENLVSIKLNALSNGLAMFQKNDLTITPQMTANRETIKRATDSIRLIISQLISSEQNLRSNRDNNFQTFFSVTKITTIVSLVIALITAVLAFITYQKEKQAKEKANKTAKIYSQQLDENTGKLQQVSYELLELKSLEKFAFSGRIARTIAHEVRNPLTNISLATEQLKEMNGGNSEADELIELIKRNSTRINQLVSDLLSSTRFTKLNYEIANINDLLDDSLKLASDRSDLKNIKIEKEYSKQSQSIRVDKERMKLAFLNIIMNAIEAMGKDGVLKISTRNSDGKCIIEFTDNGNGIPEDTLQRVFEPYFTSKPKGTGLGLTNTQNIILNHEGNIAVRNNEGRGTTFIITLNLEKN